jgi:hypothetical protein
MREHVRSVFGLEILLFLHRNEGKEFRAADVARELGFDSYVAQEHLVRLSIIGLLIGSDYKDVDQNQHRGVHFTTPRNRALGQHPNY